MNTAAEDLVQQLRPAAESGSVVNLFQLVEAMILEVTGQAAYGWVLGVPLVNNSIVVRPLPPKPIHFQSLK